MSVDPVLERRDPVAEPDVAALEHDAAAAEPATAEPNAAAADPNAAAGEPAAEPDPPAASAELADAEPAAVATGVALRAGLPARTTPPPASDRDPLDIARRIVELAEDKKAADIVLLEIAPLTTVADYLVICSGGSERQLDAIADGIAEGLKVEGERILAREGEATSHWVLLDAGAVVVHVFAPPERDFYALERLWAEARTILRVQ
jgi:ribosome-associated protein